MATHETEPVDPVEPTPEPEPEPENPDAEPDEDDDEQEGELEPGAASHVPSSLTVTEDRMKAMNAAAKSHETRLKNILREDFDSYMPCPLCLGDAFIVPAPPGAMPPEQWEAVEMAAGHFTEGLYREADYAETCPSCDGYGMVLSGSKTDAQRLIVCRPCEGKGWKAKLEAVPTQATFVFPQVDTTASPFVPRPEASRDKWGRPEGHPHYGMEPQYVGLAG